jgi:hypothetical protein
MGKEGTEMLERHKSHLGFDGDKAILALRAVGKEGDE